MSGGGIDEEYRLSRVLKRIGSSEDSRKLLNALLTFDTERIYSNARAVELLKDWVAPWEWDELKETGHVTYQSSNFSNTRFEIGKQVYAVEDEHRIFGCIQSKGFTFPAADNVLAKIIAFKKNEMTFIHTANWSLSMEDKDTQLFRYLKGTEIPARPARPNEYVYEHPLNRLRYTAENIDVTRAGLISSIPTPFGFPQSLIEACIRFGLAQGLIDYISNSEMGLCVRGILPEHDLRDGDGYKVHRWKQGPYKKGRFKVYQTSRETDNDRKVIILFGARNLKPLYTSAACGMEVKGGALLQGVQEMYIQRAHVKIIDIIDISGLQTGESIWFRTPILFKRNDDMVIMFNIPPENEGMIDNIQLLGLVVEALGSHMTG